MRKHLEVVGYFGVFEISFMYDTVLQIKFTNGDGSTIAICPSVLDSRELGHVLTLMHAYAYDTELDISYSPCDYTEDEQQDLLYDLCIEFLKNRKTNKIQKNIMFTLNIEAGKYEKLVDIGADFFVDVEPAPPERHLF